MKNKRAADLLWAESVRLFSEMKNMDLTSFLTRLIDIVKSNQDAIYQILEGRQRTNNYKFTENEKNIFRFISTITPEKYVIGTTGDDFKLIVEGYINRAPKSELEVLRRISKLVKDIITFTSSVVCPQCKSDHLRILTDIESTNLYRHCETCSFIETSDIEQQTQDSTLFPANITVLKKAGYLN
ncbi:hypothetical protein [Paenibacillus sp. FSL R7-0331]|uniref:hypothetical protein n=1 Tax=Paenibacillus sp. FSL R7-0331 TaxID=1536773 RepID=UPI0004F832FC|nr:hypothetical protein [Paenibacillus sp. FSL R7-0331]AIQ53437.1 hypothetical protein R70331_19135 [Paenibacillus sp. FSL R7-0331]